MFQILGNVGWLIRIFFAFAMAALWGYLAYIWNEMGDLGPGRPTVIGVAAMALVAAVSGLIGLVRMVGRTTRSTLPDHRLTGSITPAQRDLDADAIIARYVARREAEGAGAAAQSGAETSPAEPPTP
jgi:hypothetical protein